MANLPLFLEDLSPPADDLRALVDENGRGYFVWNTTNGQVWAKEIGGPRSVSPKLISDIHSVGQISDLILFRSVSGKIFVNWKQASSEGLGLWVNQLDAN